MTYFRERIIGNFRPEAKEAAKKSRQQMREGNDDKHRALVKHLPCSVPSCSSPPPNDGHHLKSGPAKSERAFGRRATDRRLIPLCRRHHDLVESYPSSRELEILADLGVNQPHTLAENLWKGGRSVDSLTGIVLANREQT